MQIQTDRPRPSLATFSAVGGLPRSIYVVCFGGVYGTRTVALHVTIKPSDADASVK